MSAPKRVLVATIDYPPIEGGISTLTRETALALAELGHEVTVLAPRLRPVPPDGTTPPFAKGGLGGISSPGGGDEDDCGSRGHSPSRDASDSPPFEGGSRGMSAAPDGDDQAFPPSEQSGAGSISVVTFPGYSLGVFRLIPFLFTGIPLVRRNDHVLAMNIAYGGVLGWIGRVFFGKPYTAFAYAYEFLKYRRVAPLDAVVRSLYRRAERTVAISAFSRDHLAAFGVPEASIVVAHPGARLPAPVERSSVEALRRQLGLEDGPVILSVGRLIPRKRQVDLVHAFARVLRHHPDAWLVIAGQGPEMPAISRMAIRLGIRDRVVLPGKVDDDALTGLYALCTVFALPCGEDTAGHVEGFGLVFTEANAHGKPVIAGRSGGVPDAVLDGETGMLIEPGDIEGLAGALRALLDDPARAGQLGAQGRARVEHAMSWRAFAKAAFGILSKNAASGTE